MKTILDNLRAETVMPEPEKVNDVSFSSNRFDLHVFCLRSDSLNNSHRND